MSVPGGADGLLLWNAEAGPARASASRPTKTATPATPRRNRFIDTSPCIQFPLIASQRNALEETSPARDPFRVRSDHLPPRGASRRADSSGARYAASFLPL